MDYDFDLLVIGAGSGGVRASRMAAQRGARVAIVESTYFGGTCVNVGCVPKKLFALGAHYADDFEDAPGYGWKIGETISFDWPTLRDNKNKEIERLNAIYKTLLEKNHVIIFKGKASFADANTVIVNDKKISAKTILIATGNFPNSLDMPGNELMITSNEIFYLDKLPQKMAIIGGGYIGVEFASIFGSMGVEVTLVQRGDLLLRHFDTDVRDFMMDCLKNRNIILRLNTRIKTLEKKGNDIILTTTEDDTFSAQVVLNATGRVPNTMGLNLDKIGVKQDESGAIIVDDYFQTSVPSIYALGDVIDKLQLTPVALAQAMAFVATLFDNIPTKMSYDTIPTAVFSNPTVGSVGLTEEQARRAYKDVEVYITRFKPLKHTLSNRDEKVLMKLIVDKGTDKVLGAHMAGSEAGEIIQGFAVALKAGATKAIFDSTIGIHPTSAEEFVTLRKN